MSQHTDTSNNTKTWAVLQHTDISRNTEAYLCYNTLTPAGTPRLGLCHNTLTPARTPRLGLCHNRLTPARIPRLGLCCNTLLLRSTLYILLQAKHSQTRSTNGHRDEMVNVPGNRFPQPWKHFPLWFVCPRNLNAVAPTNTSLVFQTESGLKSHSFIPWRVRCSKSGE